MNFDINYISLKKDFSYLYSDLKNNYSWLNNFKFNVLFSTSKNLNNIFTNCIRNSLSEPIICKTKKCSNLSCITCKFLYEKNFLQINNFFLPIISNCTFTSTNLVYVFICIRCNIYYIGQTSRTFTTRFK